jgi:hypothetical protein
MNSLTADPPALSASASIDAALEDSIRHARGEGIALDDVLQRLGPASFCFVCLLLAAPFLQPIPLGPYTMAGAISFMACGWQMVRGRQTPLLPKAMRKARLHGKGWVAALHLCQKALGLARRFSRPRHEAWVTGRSGEHLVGWLIIAGGILLAVPVANLPFNNTFPALMIIFAALAWLERDGLLVIVSLICGTLAVAYFAVVGLVVWLFGAQIFAWIKPVLPGN